MQSMYNSADCEAQLYVGLNLIQVQLTFSNCKNKVYSKTLSIIMLNRQYDTW